MVEGLRDIPVGSVSGAEGSESGCIHIHMRQNTPHELVVMVQLEGSKGWEPYGAFRAKWPVAARGGCTIDLYQRQALQLRGTSKILSSSSSTRYA